MMRLNKHSAYADHFTGQEVGEGEEEASEHAAGISNTCGVDRTLEQLPPSEGAQIIRKDYHVCVTLEGGNGRHSPRHTLGRITLVKDVHYSVFTSLPLQVSLAVVVDGQPVAGHAPGVSNSAKGWISDESSGVTSKIRMWFDDKLDAQQYHGHKITRYTAESGSPAGPRLTLYLKSPAVQRQEEEAAEALADATGWVTHVCNRAYLLTRSSETNRLIRLGRAIFVRAYPSVPLDGLSLQSELFRDGVAVQGVDGDCTLSCSARDRYVTVYISASAASALVGCRLQQVQAKPPNMLRVYSVTCPDTTRLQTPVNQRTAATHRVLTPRSATEADDVAPSARSTSAQQAAAASADSALVDSSQQQPKALGERAAKQAAAAAIHRTYNGIQGQSSRQLVQHEAVNSSKGHRAAVAPADHPTARKRNSQALSTQRNENASAAVTACPAAAAAAVQPPGMLQDRTDLQLKKRRSAASAAQVQLRASLRDSCGLEAAMKPKQVFKTSRQATGIPARTTTPVALAAATAAGAVPNPPLTRNVVGICALPQELPQPPECLLTGAAAARAGVADANVNLPRQPGGILAAGCSMPAPPKSRPEVIVISDSDSDDGDDGQHTAWQQKQSKRPVLQQRQQQNPMGHQLPVKSLERPTARQQAHTPPTQTASGTVTTTAAGAASGAGMQHKIKLERNAAGCCAAAATGLLQPPLQVQTTADATALAAATGPARTAAHTSPAAQLQAAAVSAAIPCTAGPPAAAASAGAEPTAEAKATAALSATMISALPSDFTLTDSNSDILSAGRQLTDLLDHLHAPDHQVMQLNDYLISLSHQSGDDNRVVRFWYDYSQIRLWVRRRNEEMCRSMIQQMVDRAEVQVAATD